MGWLRKHGIDGRLFKFYFAMVSMIIIGSGLVIGPLVAISEGDPKQIVEGILLVWMMGLLYASVGSLFAIIPAAAVFGATFSEMRRTKSSSDAGKFAGAAMTGAFGLFLSSLTESWQLPALIFVPLALLVAPYIAGKFYRNDPHLI